MAEDANEQDWPPHVQSLISNTGEVLRLLQIHRKLAGKKPGCPPDLEVLNKAAVVLLVACWEAFIEDLAKSAFDAILTVADSPDIFPSKVLTLASKSLRESQNESEVWKLAGDGWKKVMVAHRDAIFDRYIGRLNTPRPQQVDGLIECLIGMKAISRNWQWKGMSNKTALQRLEALITLRGQISHRVTASHTIHKRYAERSIELINRLAAISSNRVADYIMSLIKIEPWITVRYQETL